MIRTYGGVVECSRTDIPFALFTIAGEMSVQTPVFEPVNVKKAEVFCAGCLVLQGVLYAEDPNQAARLANEPVFAGWPLLILHDDADVVDARAGGLARSAALGKAGVSFPKRTT